MILIMEKIIFEQKRDGTTPIEQLNDWLREPREAGEPHPVGVQQLSELFQTPLDAMNGNVTAISYLITFST